MRATCVRFVSDARQSVDTESKFKLQRAKFKVKAKVKGKVKGKVRDTEMTFTLLCTLKFEL